MSAAHELWVQVLGMAGMKGKEGCCVLPALRPSLHPGI